MSPWSLYSCDTVQHGYSPQHRATVRVCSPALPLEESWAETVARTGPESFSLYLPPLGVSVMPEFSNFSLEDTHDVAVIAWCIVILAAV